GLGEGEGGGGRAAGGRAQGPLRRLRRQEPEPLHRAHLLPRPPRVPGPPPPGRGGVRLRAPYGPHHPMRRGGIPLPHLCPQVKWQSRPRAAEEAALLLLTFTSISLSLSSVSSEHPI
ncbi:Auxin-induced protein, partial [Musa troglodytarum]